MILYLHGFNSAPASHKARALQRYMAERGLGHRFSCPALPHRPAEAARLIESQIGGPGVTLVGSSLGGFYATWFAEKLGLRAVLLNPAIRPHVGLAVYLGRQKNLYSGEEYDFTQQDLGELAALYRERVEAERYLLVLETGDEVLDWREAARKYEGARMVVRDGGDHTLASFGEHIPRLLAFAGIAAG